MPTWYQCNTRQIRWLFGHTNIWVQSGFCSCRHFCVCGRKNLSTHGSYSTKQFIGNFSFVPGMSAPPTKGPPDVALLVISAVDVSFFCLAHRVTGGQSSAKQALALFHFQLSMSTAVPDVAVSVGRVVMTLLIVAVLMATLLLLCKKKKKWPQSGSYKTIEGEPATSY